MFEEEVESLKKQNKGLIRLLEGIESAMDFGENLDECAKELEYAKTIIQDLLNNSDEYARERAINFLREQNVSDI